MYKKNYNQEPFLKSICVKVINNDVDGALKKFKNVVKESKIMLDLRKYEYYRKPSQKKKEKHAKAISRYRREKNIY